MNKQYHDLDSYSASTSSLRTSMNTSTVRGPYGTRQSSKSYSSSYSYLPASANTENTTVSPRTYYNNTNTASNTPSRLNEPYYQTGGNSRAGAARAGTRTARNVRSAYVSSDIDSDADALSADLSSSGESAGSHSSSSISLDQFTDNARTANASQQTYTGAAGYRVSPSTPLPAVPTQQQVLQNDYETAHRTYSPRPAPVQSHSDPVRTVSYKTQLQQVQQQQHLQQQQLLQQHLLKQRQAQLQQQAQQAQLQLEQEQQAALAYRAQGSPPQQQQIYTQRLQQPQMGALPQSPARSVQQAHRAVIQPLSPIPSRPEIVKPLSRVTTVKSAPTKGPQGPVQQAGVKPLISKTTSTPLPELPIAGKETDKQQSPVKQPKSAEKQSKSRHHHKLGFLRLGKRKGSESKDSPQAETAPPQLSSDSATPPTPASRSPTASISSSQRRALSTGTLVETPSSESTGSMPRMQAQQGPLGISGLSAQQQHQLRPRMNSSLYAAEGAEGVRTHGHPGPPKQYSASPTLSSSLDKLDRRSIITSDNFDVASTMSTTQWSKGSSANSSGRGGRDSSGRPKPSKFFKFTKAAVRLAGDIAFGSTVLDPDREDRVAQQKRIRVKEKLLEERKRKIADLREPVERVGKQQYLENLRFFLKYMDESEVGDPVNYATTRRDMFLLWCKKYFTGLQHKIEMYEFLIDQKQHLQAVQRPLGNNAASRSLTRTSTNSSESESSSMGGASMALTSITSSSNTSSFRFSNSGIRSLGVPTMAELQKEMFQDRRVVLCLLWYLQIMEKLLQPGKRLQMRLGRRDNAAKTNVNNVPLPAKETAPEDVSDVCVITTNKLGSTKTPLGRIADNLLGNTVASNNIEFIDGWHLRHQTDGQHINVVTVADVLRTLTDADGRGVVPDEMLMQNPEFQEPRLNDQFHKFELGEREKQFLQGYSSFLTPTSTLVPLADQSQKYLIANDLTSIVSDELSLARTLDEFRRVLQPHGSLYMHLWDVDPCAGDPRRRREPHIRSTRELARYKMWQKMSAYAGYSGSAIPDITRRIVPALKKAGFRNVKTAFMGYPALMSQGNHEGGNDDDEDASVDDEGTLMMGGGAGDDSLGISPSVANLSEAHNVAQQRSGSQGSTTTDHSETKDSRANAFYETMSSFTEFLKAVKVLGLHDLDTDLAMCDELEQMQKTAGESKENSRAYLKRLGHLKELDPERLRLAKLFIDYKLHSVQGELVQTELLSTSTLALTLPETAAIDDETAYEGLGYIMVVTADRI